jgi:Tfp pilus assembly protein PilV
MVSKSFSILFFIFPACRQGRDFLYRRRRGQSLIEAIVTVGVVVLIVTGLIVSANFSLTYSSMNKKRTKALSYANEALEVARSQRMQDWNAFPAPGTSYCLGKNATSFTTSAPAGGCPLDIDTMYSRTVDFSVETGTGGVGLPCTDSTECRKVVVTVGWMENSKTRFVTLSTYITNWKHL